MRKNKKTGEEAQVMFCYIAGKCEEFSHLLFIRCVLLFRSHLREEEHILDGSGVGHHHGEAVDADA